MISFGGRRGFRAGWFARIKSDGDLCVARRRGGTPATSAPRPGKFFCKLRRRAAVGMLRLSCRLLYCRTRSRHSGCLKLTETPGPMDCPNENAENWTRLASEGSAMLPGPEPGTGLRVRVESCVRGGCVHLEQVAYSPTMGWYRQKSFTVPREMIGDLSRMLRMSDCLLPRHEKGSATASCPAIPAEADAETLPFKLTPEMPVPAHEPERRSG